MDKKQQAQKLFKHYMRTLAKCANMHWDEDNEVEITMIVDLIVAAAVDEAVQDALRAVPSSILE